MKKRIKIIISYDGSKFYGSQIQSGKKELSVTGILKKAFLALHVKEIPQASGRTDRGVHALNQVYHIDIPDYLFDLNKLSTTLNRTIHPYAHIKNIEFVNSDFHARFQAKKRLYRYIVSHEAYTPFMSDYFNFMPTLDIKTLNKGAKLFTGKHDFKYFMKKGSETQSTVREIFKSGVYRYKNHTIIYFIGNSFLRSQIRMMCDFLFKLEKGVLSYQDLKNQLNGIKRTSTSLAKPEGLYLSRIYY